MTRYTILSSAAAAVLAVGGPAFGQVQEEPGNTGQAYGEASETEEPVHPWQTEAMEDTDTADTDRFDDPGRDREVVRPRGNEAAYDAVDPGNAETRAGARNDEDRALHTRDDGHRAEAGQDAAMAHERRFDGGLEQAFNAIDSDGNGKVSRSEWAGWQADDPDYAARFDAFDRDGDRTLSWNEYRDSASQMYDTSDLPQ